MRPSQSRPQRQPRRKFNADDADIMVGELASEMIAYISALYANAADDEAKIEIVIKYGPVLRDLQTAIARASRARRRRRNYPGNVETK